MTDKPVQFALADLLAVMAIIAVVLVVPARIGLPGLLGAWLVVMWRLDKNEAAKP